MRINFISGNTIVGTVYDEFNIKSDDWVNRVPNWIYRALRILDTKKIYTNNLIKDTFSNHKIELPEYEGTIKLLTIDGAVIINRDRIDLPIATTSITITSTDIVSTNDTFNVNNALSKDESLIANSINTNINNVSNAHYIEQNILYTVVESGTYRLWYEAIPAQFEEQFQTYVPMIPDIEEVIQYLKWNIFKNILSRGYIHPVYSLGNRNQEYDPNIQFKANRMKAKLALDKMDVKDRNDIANINMAFFNLPSYQTGQVDDINQLFKEDEI